MSKSKIPSANTKRVFIVEDHPTFREGLVQIVNSEEDLIVCGEAGDVPTALEQIPKLGPDLVLVDITLPGKSGLELIRRIRSFDRVVKLLVISMHDEAIYANRVLRAGGDGYIMKQEDPDEMVTAMHDVLAGHIYVSEEVMVTMSSQKNQKNPSDPFETLSDTELEVLEMFGRGKDNQEIAQRMGLDLSVVEGCSESLKTKLKLKNNNALIHYATCWLHLGSSSK